MEFEQNKFILEAYFRNGIDNDSVWAYSVEPCLDQFRIRFPDYHCDDHCLRQKIRRTLKRIQETNRTLTYFIRVQQNGHQDWLTTFE
jgi:hypothetical protein